MSGPPDGRIPAGYALVAGAANCGKSSLLNGLVGRAVSPVTPIPGTSRIPLSGLCSGKDCQVCFVDTPPLTVDSSLELLDWMDIVCLVVDARDMTAQAASRATGRLLGAVGNRPAVLLLSHVDHFRRELHAALLAQAGFIHDFAASLAICPPRGTGLGELIETVSRLLPLRRPLFPGTCTTLHSERFLVSEVIRTELFRVLPEDIASTTAVQIEEFSLRDGKTYVRANLHVSRHSFKGIVIGRRGQTLQRIVECASEGASSILGRKVMTDLWVKVREGWTENPHDLLEFGYAL